jgi:hypothetical protein
MIIVLNIVRIIHFYEELWSSECKLIFPGMVLVLVIV